MDKALRICGTVVLLSALAFAGLPANTCANSTGSTAIASISCTITGTASNHLLVLMVTGKGAAPSFPAFGALTFSDTFNSVWKPAVTGGWGNGNIPVQQGWEMMFYSNTGANSGSEAITVTLGSSVAYVSLYVAEYANNYTLDPNHTVDFIAVGSSGTTQGLTVTQDNEILVALGMCDSGLSLNDVNWTSEGTNGNNCGRYADRSLGAGTAGNAYTSTWTLGDEQGVVVAAFGPTPPANTTHLIQQCSNANYETASVATYSCTLSGVGSNHLLAYVFATAGAYSSITDSFGLSWSKNTQTSSQQLSIGYATTGSHSGSETVTITTSAASTLTDLFVMEYGGGAWTGAVLDANNSSTLTSGTIGTDKNTGSVTTTKTGDLLITAATCDAASMNVSGSGVYSVDSSTFVREGWDATTANSTAAGCTQWADSTAGAAGNYSANWRPNAGIANGTTSGSGAFSTTNAVFMISAFLPATASTHYFPQMR